jgi:RNA polymerase sigma-70 factor (ECF subfamily)
MLSMADPEPRRARFEVLFRDHHSAVRAYARRRVPPEAVDHTVSETFLVAWRRLDEAPEPALPWLLTVARNVFGTEWRGAARRQRPWLKAQSELVEGYEPSEAEIADGRVLAALARSKERDREALTLVAWDGLTPAQAAAVLGEPSDRFRQRLHRPWRRLRVQLDDELRGAEPAPPIMITLPPEAPMKHSTRHPPELLDLVRRADPMLDRGCRRTPAWTPNRRCTR